MIAQLLAKIGVDITDLNKAEVALKSFEKSFTSAFKRQPSGELRTEAALVGSLRQIMAGDIGGAVESITHRLGIMGIVGGTAVAGLVVAFTKAHEAAKKYGEALKEAEKASKISPAASQGLQALQADLVKTAELQGRVAHDMDSRWIAMGNNVGRLGGILAETFMGGAFDNPGARHNEEDRVKAAAILEKLSGHTRDNLLRQGDAAANMAAMARAQAAGDEAGVAALKRKEEHAKAMFEAMKNYREVLDSIKDKDTRKELKPELQAARNKVEVSAQAIDEAQQSMEDRRLAMLQVELTTGAQISAVKEKGLSADIEKNALAVINIQHLTAQLNEMRGIVGATRDAKEAELDRAKAEEVGRQKREARTKLTPAVEAHSQMSLEELAGVKRTGWIGGELNRQVKQAQEVQRLMKLSEQERLAGHGQEAFRLFARAEEFKRGMPLLRESEKSPELAFLTALSAAPVLSDMRKYLETIAGAVSKENPFLNK